MKKIIGIIFLLLSSVVLIACDEKIKEEETYNIVLTNATIPPLMAVLDSLDNGNKTYMWYGRSQTFNDLSGLKNNITFLGDPENQETIPGIKPEIVTEMTNIVSELYYDSDMKANFNLYVVDYGIKAALQIFAETGISEDNYKVYLLEDGIGSYSQFSKDGYDKADGAEKFDENLAILNKLIEDVKSGNYKWDTSGNMDSWYLSYAYATMPNVEYWLQYPEILNSEDLKMQEYLANKINFKSKKLTNMFEELSSENKVIFQNSILDTEKFDSLINLDNGKESLLVTGTSYDGEELGFVDGMKGDGELEVVFDYIIENYGDKYNILFKPHPAWMPSLGSDMGVRWESHLGKERPNDWHKILTSRVNYFKDNNITVLPGQTPIEPILWSYPNVKIGGYNSSLYMNAGSEQVLFFILNENSYNALLEPLPSIIEKGGLTNSLGEKPIIISPELFESR